MPIKYIDRFIESADLATALELEAKSGEGFVIKDIFAESATEGEFITIIISDTVMLAVVCQTTLIGMVRFPDAKEAIKGLFSIIREKYPEIPLFKVCEGEKLSISRLSASTKCLVRYAHLTGADAPKPTESGATLSDNRLLLSSGVETYTVPAGTIDYLETLVSINPSGIIDFPFGVKLPSGYELDLLGFCVGLGALTGTESITGIRLWYRDESILKPDQEYQGIDLFGYLGSSGQLKPFLFDTPLKLVAGDELKLEVEITGTENDTGDCYATFIFNQKRV